MRNGRGRPLDIGLRANEAFVDCNATKRESEDDVDNVVQYLSTKLLFETQ